MRSAALLASALVGLIPAVAGAQATAPSPRPETRPAAQAPATRTIFVPLGNGANALLVEPTTLDPVRSRIVVLVAHPEDLNTFNYFFGRVLPAYGYRVMMVNTYAPERTYEGFVAPLAAAITALRAMPGVEKIILAGHSTGGPELTAYQDIAENGPAACQGAERIYKCGDTVPADRNQTLSLTGLPRADGLMLLDSNAGAPARTLALDPSVAEDAPRTRNPALDMFAAANGYDAASKGGHYSAAFRQTYFAAQAARANRLIETASERLAKVEAGEGLYLDDEPFVVPGSDLHVNGARLDLADTRLLSRSHAPHLVLRADGTTPTEIVTRIAAPAAQPEDQGRLYDTTLNVTVRHFLSFDALRLTPDYALTADDIRGVVWRSTANSVPGNVEGIHVPTLIMAATCAQHLTTSEIAFDRSAATDKTFVGVEGANHGFQPCKPEYGDTLKRTFDYVDGWLTAAGRFQ
jgi:pimeloyl-ACP methyl ester carboxylesterase